MTVSSGFYVRCLAHDLGLALGTNAIMSSLVRTRQGDFELAHDKVLEYKDLEAGEGVWGPKVERFLDAWVSKKERKTGLEKTEEGRRQGEESDA
jgi:tRNA pseudouridine55 synthase